MRRAAAILVTAVVAASCIPWVRHRSFFSVFVAIITIAFAGLLVFGGVRALFVCMKNRRQQRETTHPGWWSPKTRNLCLGAALIIALMFTLPHFVAISSEPYKLAVATAHRTPQFTEVLGAPVTEAWFSEGRTEYGNLGKAELTIPVTGSKEKGDLRAVAINEDGRWKLKELTLELAQSGKHIDLLANTR